MTGQGTARVKRSEEQSNIIEITGHISMPDAVKIVELMQIIGEQIEAEVTEKSIGFLISSHGADHDAIRSIVGAMDNHRKAGFSFFVHIDEAHSGAVLIVAQCDNDGRYILPEGKVTIHDGNMTVEFNEIDKQLRVPEARYIELAAAVAFYREKLWWSIDFNPIGLVKFNLKAQQLETYKTKGKLQLSVHECIEQLGFKLLKPPPAPPL